MSERSRVVGHDGPLKHLTAFLERLMNNIAHAGVSKDRQGNSLDYAIPSTDDISDADFQPVISHFDSPASLKT
jgi:hypothetical protein